MTSLKLRETTITVSMRSSTGTGKLRVRNGDRERATAVWVWLRCLQERLQKLNGTMAVGMRYAPEDDNRPENAQPLTLRYARAAFPCPTAAWSTLSSFALIRIFRSIFHTSTDRNHHMSLPGTAEVRFGGEAVNRAKHPWVLFSYRNEPPEAHCRQDLWFPPLCMGEGDASRL